MQRRSYSNKKLLGWAIVMSSILSACNQYSQPITSTAFATYSPSPLSKTSTPNSTSTANSTKPIVATNTPESTLSATLVSEVILTVFQIESGEYNYDFPELSRSVIEALWSEDEEFIYYALAPSVGEKPLKWAAYDVSTRSVITIPSPLGIDSSFWQRLSIPEPSTYWELSDYVSPSHKYVIYPIHYGASHEPSAKTEIWISDTDEQRKIKLLEFNSLTNLHQVAWFHDETNVLFDVGYEGPAELYVADIQRGVATPIADIADFEGLTEDKWALSPDGKTLAITYGGLRLVTMENGRSKLLESYVAQPYWSKDSRLLYYWWGPSFDEIGNEMRVYDITTGTISTVIDKSSLARVFHNFVVNQTQLAPDFYLGAPFEISSGGNQIVIWGGWLWLIEVRK